MKKMWRGTRRAQQQAARSAENSQGSDEVKTYTPSELVTPKPANRIRTIPTQDGQAMLEFSFIAPGDKSATTVGRIVLPYDNLDMFAQNILAALQAVQDGRDQYARDQYERLVERETAEAGPVAVVAVDPEAVVLAEDSIPLEDAQATIEAERARMLEDKQAKRDRDREEGVH